MAGTGAVRAEQAGALLLSLLADGPKPAAEILAAAEGAKIARRTLQLEATKLGVLRAKPKFSAGWTWALPDSEGQEAPERLEEPMVPEAAAPADDTEAVVERAKAIAGRLSKLEERRTRIRSRIHWQDPRIQAWAAAGVRDYQLREAYDLATSDPDWDGPLTASILSRFVDMVMADEGATV